MTDKADLDLVNLTRENRPGLTEGCPVEFCYSVYYVENATRFKTSPRELLQHVIILLTFLKQNYAIITRNTLFVLV